MSRFYFYFIAPLLLFIFSGCEQPSEAQRIVDSAIEEHGGDRYKEAKISFDFRDRHYTYERDGGLYTYTREFTDSTGSVKDVLNNDGFHRLINGNTAELTDERKNAFSSSVNSVIYFALLPYGLNDPAVKKEYIGQTAIEGKDYHLIRVSFAEEGGGEDFNDEFLYWINTQTNTVDYLAYSYNTDEKGVRFRKAMNPRKLGGILFQDYVNYKPAREEVPLEALESLYKEGALEELSKIELQNIQVE